MNEQKRWPFNLQFWKRVGLRIVIERLLSLLPGGLSLLQKVVVEPAALVQNGLSLCGLLPGQFKPVFERFKHEDILT